MDLGLRKTYRANLSKLANAANEMLNADITNVNEIHVLIARIKALQSNLNNVNERLSTTFSDEQIDAECIKIAEYDDVAVEVIARLEERAKLEEQTPRAINLEESEQQRPYGVAAAEGAWNGGNRFGNTHQTTQGNMSVRLPKLDLVKFNGNIASWPAFWEQFCLAVHENKDLNDAAKFAYLKSYLSGKAAVTVAGLTSSKSSYKDAIDLLKEEYANSERIVDSYIQKLLTITPVRNERDISALHKLYNTASTITRSLSTLGLSPEQYGLMVKSIIFKALPYNMRVTFNKEKITSALNESETGSQRSVGSDGNVCGNVDYDKQINNLLQFIKVELDSIEQARCEAGWDDRPHIPHKDKEMLNRNKRTDEFTAAGLLTFANEGCLFCKIKSHQTKDCHGSLSIENKKRILKQNGCCFRCTKPSHTSKFCKTSIFCTKCKRRHATSMCDPSGAGQFRKDQARNNNGATSDAASIEKPTALLANGRIDIDNVYLKTARSFILTDDNRDKQLIRIVIDGGSQLTFIKESISRFLGLPVIGKHKISINRFGTTSKAPATLCNRVLVSLKSQYNDEIIELSAIEVPEICFDTLKPPSLKDPVIHEFASKYQLADIHVEHNLVNGITLLVGADNYWKIITGETKRLSNELTAVTSWDGRYMDQRLTLKPTVLKVPATFEDVDLKDFWALETIGINSNEKTKEHFTETFVRDNINFKNGRYEVSLPWKDDSKLDSNYAGALARAKNLVTKLQRMGKLSEYDKAVREYIENNCAEIAPSDTNHEHVYYMPHRPVYREDKETTKVRVVFDASAHAQGFASLNERLFVGDNLVPDLLRVLLNFRTGSIGLIADIEKAFLQISLAEEDRDSHRFLWFSEPIEECGTMELCTYRMKRVTFGVTTSPFLLSSTLRKHLSSQPEGLKRMAGVLSQSFYVDDLVITASSFDEANEIYEQSRGILRSANMNLRKWCSNDYKMMHIFGRDGEYSANVQLKKVLGIQWYTATDELAVDVASIMNCQEGIPTKRNVLQNMAKIYDPFGMLGPFSVRIKILLQMIWKEKWDWDTILPEGLQSIWFKWCAEVTTIAAVQISRSVVKNKFNEVELHVFADASVQAYGAVAYVKCLTTNEANFLMSKNRVAPINQKGNKELTLPKLELAAALCAVRLQAYIMENSILNIKNVVLWSDSKISLYWIRGQSSKWKPYVQNRVSEIQKLSKGPWRHCPGKENPADLLTRGVSAKFLAESILWFHGPTWLNDDLEKWPKDEYYDDEDSVVEVTNLLINKSEEKLLKRSPVFPLEKYSEMEKILRITAYVKRFIKNMHSHKEKITGNLTINEINEAEGYWIKLTQQEEFPNELESLLNKKALSSKSAILTLNPFLDEDDIMRLGSRLEESSLAYETRYPVILPRSSPFTERLIWRCHEMVLHSGVNATLALAREKYWIIRGRQQVKTTLRKCLKCKRLRGKSGSEPFAPLPRSRINIASPFKITGIDFAGPLYITERGQRSKTYIMLFTCAVVRAVHLELVPNLTTESCVRGLRRFMARRGVPEVIYSDNAKTFRRTSQELQELFSLLRSDKVQEFVQKYRIDWRFIVERAAWWGGFWERMVKTVKDALKITLGKALINHEELETVLTEVEATVNSRPLTYIDDDSTNLLILSPSHFLIGEKNVGLSMDLKLPDFNRNEILSQWKRRERLMARFWKKWCIDYLQQLRNVHHSNRIESRSLKTGDVALLYQQHVPRLQWKMVRVTEVYQGRDGRVRACTVQTSDGTKLRRPVQLLFPVEVDNSSPREDVKN